MSETPYGYAIETYRGYKIRTLPHYTTPYYFTCAKRWADRALFGTVQHTRSLAALRRRIDRAESRMVEALTQEEGA